MEKYYYCRLEGTREEFSIQMSYGSSSIAIQANTVYWLYTPCSNTAYVHLGCGAVGYESIEESLEIAPNAITSGAIITKVQGSYYVGAGEVASLTLQ